MIKNEKQLQVTLNRIEEFKASIEAIEASVIDPIVKVLQINALKSQLDDFYSEVEEYESLKRGPNQISSTFENIPQMLIKCRIARNWTHADLASHVGLKEQQIQRYEACNYATASFPRLLEIADALDINFSKIQAHFKSEPILLNSIDNIQIEAAKQKLRHSRSLFAS